MIQYGTCVYNITISRRSFHTFHGTLGFREEKNIKRKRKRKIVGDNNLENEIKKF